MAKVKRDERGVPQSEVDAIAERLRISREAKGLTPTQLCKLTGIGKSTYSNWENGHGRPDIDQAKILCKKLGYTLDWIYLGEIAGLPSGLAIGIGDQGATDKKGERAA